MFVTRKVYVKIMIVIIETSIGSSFSEPLLTIWRVRTNKPAVRYEFFQYFLFALSKYRCTNISG